MSIYNQLVEEMSGLETTLKEYQGKVLLIVNTASKCGYTPQFVELQELYKTYQDKGFVILGFPCGQFLNQELDTNDEILSFCQSNYGVSFPMYAKTFVRGRKQSELYRYLIKNSPVRKNRNIKWNFEKFLIDQEGNIVNRYLPKIKPSELKEDIESLLE